MPCFRPHIERGGAYACGKCLSCRIQHRRVWTHRIILEAQLHEANAFCTLTYDDDHLPGDNSLDPRELQLFIKRLRKVSPLRLRFYACGEYGTENGRPHYHLALFNFPSCHYGITRPRYETCCPQCALVRDAWGNGGIQLAQLESKSAAYIAGYVTKGSTTVPLGDRCPPFSRMSLRPGIGHDMMHELASVLLKENLDETLVDVPSALAHGRKALPLGRYLRRKLRKMIGRTDYAPPETIQTQAEEMQALRARAAEGEKAVSKLYQEEILGKRRQIESRDKLYNKRNML